MTAGMEMLAVEYATKGARPAKTDEFRKQMFRVFQTQAIAYNQQFKDMRVFQQIQRDIDYINEVTTTQKGRLKMADIFTQDIFNKVATWEIDSTFQRLLNRRYRVFYRDMAGYGATVGIKLMGETTTIPQIKITDTEALYRIDFYAEDFAKRALHRFMDAYRRELRDSVYMGLTTLQQALNRIVDGQKFAVTLRPHVEWAANQAYNLGLLAQFTKAGVRNHKWVTISGHLDITSRHYGMHGQVQPVGATFPETGEIFPSQRCPGCKCTIIPVVEGETFPWTGEPNGFSLNQKFL